jgi:hypothetical protein
VAARAARPIGDTSIAVAVVDLACRSASDTTLTGRLA